MAPRVPAHSAGEKSELRIEDFLKIFSPLHEGDTSVALYSDADRHSELKPIGFTTVVRNRDRHRIGRARRAAVAPWTRLTVDFSPEIHVQVKSPGATEEADSISKPLVRPVRLEKV